MKFPRVNFCGQNGVEGMEYRIYLGVHLNDL